MPDHCRRGLRRPGDTVYRAWQTISLKKTIFDASGSGWKWVDAGYYMKDITRVETDDMADYDIHITINAMAGSASAWRVNSPHVTFQYLGRIDNAIHVYYDFLKDEDKAYMQYVYTDRSDDDKWRIAAFTILRDQSGLGVGILGDYNGA
jgi:hypothetical protein